MLYETVQIDPSLIKYQCAKGEPSWSQSRFSISFARRRDENRRSARVCPSSYPAFTLLLILARRKPVTQCARGKRVRCAWLEPEICAAGRPVQLQRHCDVRYTLCLMHRILSAQREGERKGGRETANPSTLIPSERIPVTWNATDVPDAPLRNSRHETVVLVGVLSPY